MPDGFSFEVAGLGATTAVIYRAREPLDATFVFAHGAGAPQTHPFIVDMAERLSRRGLDVVTFDFLYRANGRKLPDRNEILEATWRAAIASVRARFGLPGGALYIGGKSMGGRIASQVAAARDIKSLAGLVMLGYPLHPPKKPRVRRDEHLPRVACPMLFIQGSRDLLGNEKEMKALVKTLPRAELHVVPGGDHSLAVSKRAVGDKTQDAVLDRAAAAVELFVRGRRQRR